MITAAKEKAAAQMPTIVSLSLGLWLKKGRMGRLMIWLMKT